MIYRDLPEVGMPFVTPEDPQFHELKSQIAIDPFGRKLDDLPSEAVVVLNQSGQPVLAMSFLWKWTDDIGGITQHGMAGLNSLSQLEFEPADPRRIRFHPFLAGSKRLVTSAGVFGDNSDVLPADTKPSGFVGGFAGGFGRANMRQPERHLVEIQLDSVIFADGLCAGADEMGILATLGPVATEQQRIASEAAALLRNGAKFGEVFDLLRTTARHPAPTLAPRTTDPSHLLFSFGRQAMDRLIHAQDERRDELVNWFDEQSRQPKLKFRRYQ